MISFVENYFDTIIALSSAIISIIALIFTVKAFWLKKGAKIRGYVNFCSDIESEDHFPSEIVLENEKDKAIVIYKIFVRFGYNCYLLIEDFGDKPLVISAFESYKKKYDPIVSYSANMNRVSIDNLIKDRNLKHKIYLSTSEGKIVVSFPKKRWDPIALCFKNYATSYISPDRVYYKGKAYGSRILYIVELKKDGKEDILSFTSEDSYLIKYKNIFKGDLKFNKKAFESADKLKFYFMKLKNEHMLDFDEINIIDFQKYLGMNYQVNKERIEQIQKLNGFQYYFLGKLLTHNRDRKIKKENRGKKISLEKFG